MVMPAPVYLVQRVLQSLIDQEASQTDSDASPTSDEVEAEQLS